MPPNSKLNPDKITNKTSTNVDRKSFSRAPDVTEQINATDAHSSPELAKLTLQRFLRHIEPWLITSGLSRLNISADELFNILWAGDMKTTMSKVTFNDRWHFLRTWLMHARRKAKRIATQTRQQHARVGQQDSLPEPASIDKHLEACLQVTEILSLLDDENLRQIVEAKILEGRTLKEIGDARGVSPQAIDKRLKRALRILQEKLTDERST